MQRPLEGMSALCLQDSAEGKRGRMPWRDIWRGQARFASKGADEKEIVYVHKKATTLPEWDQPCVGMAIKKRKKYKKKKKVTNDVDISVKHLYI